MCKCNVQELERLIVEYVKKEYSLCFKRFNSG